MGLLLGLLIGACQFGGYYGPPRPGIHFRASLPEASAQFSFADRFATELAKRSGFKIVGADQSSNENEVLAARNIDLRLDTDKLIYVTIGVYTKKKLFFVTIEGPDSSSPTALSLSKNAQDIYVEWFPGEHLETFNSHQGIFWP